LSYYELRQAVREQLGQERRFEHVVRVARLAERLAMRHGQPAGKARLAGMLHDLARLFPPDRLIAECEARGMAIDGFERRRPVVLHARLGAELARERFGVDDEAVLSAIRKHTLADAAMSPLDAIVYLADGLEPGRRFAERGELEALAFVDIDAAMIAVLTSTIAHQLARYETAPQTSAALAFYQRRSHERSLLSA